MTGKKVVVTLDEGIVHEIDRLVAAGIINNRSRFVEGALHEKLERRRRLARECAKIDPRIEKALAEQWMAGEPLMGGKDS